MHARAQIIYQRLMHIQRKKRILKYVYGNESSDPWGGDGALSKGKIHCSCPYCAEKTNVKTMRMHSTYHKNSLRDKKNWPLRDVKKLLGDQDDTHTSES